MKVGFTFTKGADLRGAIDRTKILNFLLKLTNSDQKCNLNQSSLHYPPPPLYFIISNQYNDFTSFKHVPKLLSYHLPVKIMQMTYFSYLGSELVLW